MARVSDVFLVGVPQNSSKTEFELLPAKVTPITKGQLFLVVERQILRPKCYIPPYERGAAVCAGVCLTDISKVIAGRLNSSLMNLLKGYAFLRTSSRVNFRDART